MTNEPQSASSAETSVEDRLRRFDRVALLAGGGVLAAVFALIALVLTLGGTYEGPAPALQVTPAGADAPRLGPIVVTFPEAPETREGADLVSLEPATTGTFAWLDDRTLLFQPEFPGLLRGKEYQVRVASEAAGGEEDFVQTFTVEGKLEVRSVIPAPDDGDVPSEARIFVQFSRAVAPLTLLSEASTAPVVQFDPPLAGQGEWLNTSLYTFTPEDLRPSTTYRATVAAGLTSAADGVLDSD
ncbi:MAG: Ig-like domain-containing protein, partial [Dehalococcoidia bacterium]|nr:Ig-like domain-containing protein [Dehalococcoidia bacterium]